MNPKQLQHQELENAKIILEKELFIIPLFQLGSKQKRDNGIIIFLPFFVSEYLILLLMIMKVSLRKVRWCIP
jgi:hypothetical protein